MRTRCSTARKRWSGCAPSAGRARRRHGAAFAAQSSAKPQAAANAALLRAREAESADNASDWIRKLLSADGRDGASAAAARGKNDFSLAQEQEVRETESFSLSLERDARRYDGGFLFY